MARLIDADALERWLEMGYANANPLDYITKATFAECLAKVKASPTIDAEPVVRCKDCMYRGNELVCPMCRAVHTWNEDDGSDWYVVDNTADNGYCHMGEKMDGGAEDEKL